MDKTSLRGRKVALYLSSRGNYFFREIRDLLAAGFKELGVRVEDRDERKGFSRTADAHVIVAPHEFFYIGAGIRLRKRPLPPRTAVYTTEQIDSEWFPLARRLFGRAAAVWEIDRQTSRHIAARGHDCRYVPLGYAKGSGLFDLVRKLPKHHGTVFLEPEAVTRSRWGEPLRRRPIDVFFAGSQTPRRERFFSLSAPVFSKYRTYFHFTDVNNPIQAGSRVSLDTRLSVGLVQRSKIALNLHRSQARYVEWQRLVIEGIGQKTLIVSEPCTDSFPLKPGRDFVEAPLGDMPGAVEHYLSSAAGRREAQRIADRGFRTLSTEGRQSGLLLPAVGDLIEGRRRGSRRSEPVVLADSSAPSEQPARAEVSARARRARPAPKAAVAVTLHNYEDCILPCLESVRKQTVGGLDLIVVDDASTDASSRRVKRWLSRHGRRFSDYRLIRHARNGGLAKARNTGFEAARTPYVFVLDADNMIYPRCVERLSAALENCDAHFAYSYLNKFGEADGLMNAKVWRAAAFRKGNYLDAMVLMRKGVWESLGGYRSHGIQGWEDYDFWLRLAKIGGWGVLVPEILAAYRVHMRSMLHRETNPNAEQLQGFFAEAFGTDLSSRKTSDAELACTVFGSHQPPVNGSARKWDKYRATAFSLLKELNRDLA